MATDVGAFRVEPGKHVHLEDWDPQGNLEIAKDKEEAEARTAELTRSLDELQELLYADHRHALLIVLQGMDTAGKDSTIRHIFSGVDPQGVRVASFKVPTPAELDHDFLWRVHTQTPAKGEIAIFNRSHYEDVLVVRVHKLVEPEVWHERYAAINAFEQNLLDEGTTVLKFFLHISADVQKRRLQERLQDPRKRWKFSSADLKERPFWPDYMHAYEDVLEKTSTSWAPWVIVPADRHWYRDLLISEALVQALKGMDLHYPQPAEDLEHISIV
jgi:PPK2 family polyphosphate:nucleotide phosphotransferase